MESQEQSTAYEFSDEGADVEVRVRIPLQILGGVKLQNSSSQGALNSRIAVDTQEDSLIITHASTDAVFPLLVARPLFGRVVPNSTVWYAEEEDVVVVLKKFHPQIQWPALLQALPSLGKLVSGLLQSLSVFIVGPSTEWNNAIAKDVATLLGHVPLCTEHLVEQVAKCTVAEVADAEGLASVHEAEVAILASVTTNVRLVVATMGRPFGAATVEEAAWDSLQLGTTIHLSPDPPSNTWQPPSDPKLLQRSNVFVPCGDLPGGFEREQELRQLVVERVLVGLKSLLEENPDLPKEKNLLIRMGPGRKEI